MADAASDDEEVPDAVEVEMPPIEEKKDGADCVAEPADEHPPQRGGGD